MASGVKISDEVKATYQQVAITSSKTQKLKCAIFKFTDDLTKIVVENTKAISDMEAEGLDYDKIISQLPADEVRYIAYDFDFVSNEGANKSSMVLVLWCPDKATIKRKMVGASSLNALMSALSINKNVLQGDCLNEVDGNAVLEKLGGKKA